MPAEDIPFERIGGYRVVRRLATGGTSDVLLARAEGPHGFERTVVLKLLLQQYQRDAPMEKMFAREAAAYARLSHPAIVKLYDFFSAEGQLVMVLEFVDGLPLNRFRAILRKGGDALDDRASIFVASRIFAALAAAHGARDPETGEFAPMIHRDVNPSNVLIPWDGHVKLADFGIAKIAGVPTDTQSGYIKGTYGYMAPEQVRGEPVTVRTDVYAASLLLWELLARRKAIQRGALPETEVLRAMAEPSLPSLDVLRPDLPQRLRQAVMRGLESQPDQRSVTAEEMLVVLRESVTSNEGRNVLVDMLARVRPETSDLVATQSRTPEGSAAARTAGRPPPPPPARPRTPAPPATAPKVDPAPVAASPRPPEVARPQLLSRTMVGIAPTPLESLFAQPSLQVSPSSTEPALGAASARAPEGPPPATVRTPSAPPPPVAATPAPQPVTEAPVPVFFAAARPANGAPAHQAPMRVPISSPPPPPAYAPTPAPAPVQLAGIPTEPMRLRAPVTPPHVTTVPIGAGKSATYALVAGVALVASAAVVSVLLLVNRVSSDTPRPHAVVGAVQEAVPVSTAAPGPVAVPPPTPVSTAPTTPAPAPPSTAPAPTLAATPLTTSTTGRILTPRSMGSHRVFVDGRYAGDTPSPVTVRCGQHAVKIGSHGAPRTVDVPCGGDVTLVGR